MDLGYVDLTEIEAIISPALLLNMMFDVTNCMIQLLNLKGVLVGSPTDETNMHLKLIIHYTKSRSGRSQTQVGLFLSK